MRQIISLALVATTLALSPCKDAAGQTYTYGGCNAQGTCGTATLFIDSMTRQALSVFVDIRWAAEAPGALAGPALAGIGVGGVGGAWDRGGNCEYPTGVLRTRCGVTFNAEFPRVVAPDFQPTTITLPIGYGLTPLRDPVSVAPLTLIAVPEPTTIVLLGSGLLALGGVARRRSRRVD